jgi:hypothetical protein
MGKTKAVHLATVAKWTEGETKSVCIKMPSSAEITSIVKVCTRTCLVANV